MIVGIVLLTSFAVWFGLIIGVGGRTGWWVSGASLGDCSYLLQLYFHHGLCIGERSSRQLVSQPTLREAKES